MANDDVVFTIGGDATSILDALNQIARGLQATVQNFDTIAKASDRTSTATAKGMDTIGSKMTMAATMGTVFGNVVTGALDKVVGAIESTVMAVPRLVEGAAHTGDQFLTLSQQTGVSVEAISQFDFVAEQAGVSLQIIARSAYEMGLRLENASDGTRKAVKNLGLNIADLKKQKPEEAFVTIFDALKKIPDAAQRSAAGTEIFGGKFRLISSLAQEDIKGLMAEADKMGGTWSEAMARAADAFGDAQSKFGDVFKYMQDQIGQALLPAATKLVSGLSDRFTEIFKSFGGGGKGIADIADRVVTSLLTLFDKLWEAIKPLVPVLRDLGSKILAGLPAFIDMFAGALNKAIPFVSKIVDLILSVDPATLAWAASIGVATLATETMGGSLVDTAASLATITSGFLDLAKTITFFPDRMIALVQTMSMGVKSFGDMRASIQLAGEAAGITFNNLGLLGSAAAAAGVAFVGWQIGRWIAEMSGVDELLAGIIQKLDHVDGLKERAKGGAADRASVMAEMQAVEAQLAEAQRLGNRQAEKIHADHLQRMKDATSAYIDVVPRAIKAGADANIQYADAAKYLQNVETVRLSLFDRSEKAQIAAADAYVALGKMTRAEADKWLAKQKEMATSTEKVASADAIAALRAELYAESLHKLTPAQVAAARAMYDYNKSASEAVKLLMEKKIITDEDTLAVTKQFEAWTKADKPLKDFKASMESMNAEIVRADKAGTTWSDRLTKYGPSALKALEDAAYLGKDAVAAIPQEVMRLAVAMKAKELTSAIEDFGRKLQANLTLPSTEKSQAWFEEFRKFGEAMAQADIDDRQRTLIGSALRLDQLKVEHEAKLKAIAEEFKLDANARATMSAREEQRYQHQVDLAETSYSTIEERMRASNVLTVKEQEDNVAKLRRVWLQMAASGKYSADQVRAAWSAYYQADQALRGKWGQSWVDSLSKVGGFFEQLATIAQGSLSDITRAIGSTISSIGGMVQGIQGMKDSFAQISARESAESSAGLADMVGGIAGVAGAVGQLTQMAMQLGKALHDAFTRSDAEKTAADLRRTLKMDVDENSAIVKKITDDQEKLKVSRQDALRLNMSSLLKEAELTNSNFNTYLQRTGELTRLMKMGGEIGDRAIKEMDGSLVQLGQHLLDNGGLWTNQFIDLLDEATKSGQNLAGVMEMIEGQLARATAGTSKLTSGLTDKLTAAFEKSSGMKTDDEAADLARMARRLTAERMALNDVGKGGPNEARINEIDKWFDDNILRLDKAERERVSAAMRANSDIRDNYQTEFDRVSRITLASFNAYIKQGKSAIEATEALGSSIDDLKQASLQFGLAGNAAFEKLAHWRDLTEANRPLLDQVSGLTDLMGALSNLGGLTVDTFKDMQAQGLATFAQLQAAGFSETEALTAMTPYLQQIIELHRTRGLTIDDETAKMIAQAKAAGTLTDQQLSVQDVLSDGFGMVNEALIALIEALGGDVPEALRNFGQATKDTMTQAAKDAEQAAKDMQDSFNRLQMPDVTFDYPGGAGTEPIPSFAGRPLERVTSEGLAMLHPGDVVGVPQRSNRSDPGMPDIVMMLDKEVIGRIVGRERATHEELARGIKLNPYGLGSAVRQV